MVLELEIGQEGTLWSDGTVPKLYGDGGCTTVYIYPNSSNCTLKMGDSCGMLSVPQNTAKKEKRKIKREEEGQTRILDKTKDEKTERKQGKKRGAIKKLKDGAFLVA